MTNRCQPSVQVLIARSLQKGKSIASVVKESSQGLGAAAGHGRAAPPSGNRVPQEGQPVSRQGTARPGGSA